MKRRKVEMKNGFTLIELLIVIAIMSILTVITVSQFETARKKARDVQRKADLSSLSKALQMYYVDYGKFPEESGGGINLTGAVWGGTFEDATVSPAYVYMKVVPKENKTGYSYCYKVSTDLKKMALFADLENKVDKECDRNEDGEINATDTRTCNGVDYCYYVTSPNASLSVAGELL